MMLKDYLLDLDVFRYTLGEHAFVIFLSVLLAWLLLRDPKKHD